MHQENLLEIEPSDQQALSEEASGLEIAVVGMAGRFPGAADVEALWRNLAGGVESVRFFTDEELLAAGTPEALLTRPDYVRARALLEEADLFDAGLFGLSPLEAAALDPQHRLFLEVSWQALENAGHAPETFPGAVGVYGGVSESGYFLRQIWGNREVTRTLGAFQAAVAHERDFFTTRASYKLGLDGPSVAVQTACSTSLVAVHVACQALLAGECDLALAGGASITVPQVAGYFYQEGGISSPDGHSHAFDERAAGTVGGDGVGVVVLRRLEDALADGDAIRAVLLGTAVNNDGAGRAGFTAPSVEGQTRVLRAALAAADIEPETIGYVEAHGAATPLGDPTEIAALNRAFARSGSRPLPAASCAVGSVKTNIGHLDAAAGVSGLIKTVLALEARQLPPSLHYERPNPQIDFAAGPFYVNTELRDWAPRGDAPRRAGVSSFGLGGTNAHAVLEEAPSAAGSGVSRAHQLLLLSTHTSAALETATDRLVEHLERYSDLPLADIAHTLRRGRRVLRHRRALVVPRGQSAAELLAARDPRSLREGVEEERRRPVVFLLAGVGEQYQGMARELYEQEPEFRRCLDRCCELLEEPLGVDLLTLLLPPQGDTPKPTRASDSQGAPDLRRLLGRDPEPSSAEPLDRTLYAQPAVFAVGYALARTWMSWGIVPQALIGYSLGEYLAACLSGALSLEDTLDLVAARARLIDELPSGVMLAVPLAEPEVTPHLQGSLAVAAANAPHLSVVAGPEDEATALEERLAAKGIVTRRLRTTHAFHSPMMQPIAERFAATAGRVRVMAPRIPFVSNVTGTWVREEDLAAPDYWVRHLLGTVRFSQGVEALLSQPGSALVEIGPGRTLGTFVRQHPGGNRPLVSSLPPREEAGADAAHLLDALGRLWLAGVPVDWRGFVTHEERRIVPLPGYPFERHRFWIEKTNGASAGTAVEPAAPPSPGEAKESVLVERAPAGQAPSFARPALPTPYVEAEEGTERVVAAVWRDLLGLDRVGRNDSFFELGGHSLLATQVVSRLREELDVDLPLRSLTDAPTPALLAAEIDARREQGEDASDAMPALAAVEPAPAAVHESFPLTDVQEAYWIGRGAALALGNVATHYYLEKEVERLDVERYQLAWRRLIERHDMLRAVFPREGEQRILKDVPPYEIRILDLRGKGEKESEKLLAEIRQQMSHQVIPADRWPLFEVRASIFDGGQVRLHLSYDFLIFDAWSFEILSDELDALYRDPDTVLPALELSFRDYVMAERALRETELFHRSRKYWLERLEDLPPAPELPLAVRPETIEKPHFASRTDHLERDHWGRLKAEAQVRSLTPTALLLACFGEVLALWSKNPRFTLNLTLFNRLPIHPQIESLVGDFSSLTLLSVDGRSGPSFAERARRLQVQLWDDLDHRYFSGVQVMRELARERGSLNAAMMPVVVTSTINLAPGAENDEEPSPKADQGKHVYSISQTPQVWLDHQVTEIRGRLLYNWDAVEELFPAGLLDDLFAAYQRLIHRLADRPEVWDEPGFGAVFHLLPESQEAVRKQVNATGGPAPEALLHAGFESWARQAPDQPALLMGDLAYSYGDLDRASARLASRLTEAGAKPGAVVAVASAKGWQQAAAVLAVLRTGGIYLPVNPDLPEKRREWLLDHAGARFAVADGASARDLSWPEKLVLLPVEEDLLAPGSVPTSPNHPVSLDQPAYIVYTSGSTGQPKGVTVDHRAAVNTLQDMVDRFSLGPEDRVLALSSLSFDLSVFDFFGIWRAGGAAVMVGPEAVRDPAMWSRTIVLHRVTLWNTVPALFQMLVDYGEGRADFDISCLRLAWLSGDWIPVDLPARARALAPRLSVISLGGATEAAIWSICHPTEGPEEGWPSIPYGRPLRNQRWHVLDDSLQSRPDWVPGQLYIAGSGLAQGYWNDPQRTAESFIIHPGTGVRLYRTGDLGRWRPGGILEFLGREDFQVKIQGHRIELGEVEAHLLDHPGVSATVALALGPERGSKRLVAYVVPEEGVASQATLEGELTAWLQDRLPAYMVPAVFVSLEKLPLTANGKVDRRALPEPSEASAPAPVATGGALARQIEELVAEVLNLEAVSQGENLLQLGATSIEIIKLASRLLQEFGAHPELEELFTLLDVAALVAWYERLQAQETPETAEPQEPWFKVIFDPEERYDFKVGRPGLRRFPEADAVALPTVANGFPQRASIRSYATTPLSMERFARLLYSLTDSSQPKADGEPQLRYASAGGMYPLQTYVEVRPGRIEGLEAGLWYLDPGEHRLVALAPGVQSDPQEHAWINRTIYEHAAFCLYLVADLAAIGPMYGPIGQDYCWLEAGLVSQLLETVAGDADIGLCQIGIGGVETDALREPLGLSESHLFIHCLYGGPLDPTLGEKARQAPLHTQVEGMSETTDEDDWEEGEF